MICHISISLNIYYQSVLEYIVICFIFWKIKIIFKIIIKPCIYSVKGSNLVCQTSLYVVNLHLYKCEILHSVIMHALPCRTRTITSNYKERIYNPITSSYKVSEQCMHNKAAGVTSLAGHLQKYQKHYVLMNTKSRHTQNEGIAYPNCKRHIYTPGSIHGFHTNMPSITLLLEEICQHSIKYVSKH